MAGDPIANLATDDGRRFRVVAALSGTKRVATWHGQVSVDAAGATALHLIYDGSASRSVNHSVWVYNFAARGWERFGSTTVSTSDRSFSWSTTTPATYVSSTGLARMRVHTTSSDKHTARADLMRFVVEY